MKRRINRLFTKTTSLPTVATMLLSSAIFALFPASSDRNLADYEEFSSCIKLYRGRRACLC